jgi:bifunctional UDP-N-acetylglucosamine pyrophosphorylase/glucosamine-1-phosphate N-acetyltransferase
MDQPAAVILAAGKSTRMQSELPKVLHEICGRPMIEYILDTARAAGARRLIVIVGHKAEVVRQALSKHRDVEFALQAEQKGTGHAVMMSREHLAHHNGPVLVLAGDTPLLRSTSLAALLADLRAKQAVCVVGTAMTEANRGLGRIVRDPAGQFVRIVEEKDATPAEKEIQEINTGCFAFDREALFAALDQLRPNNRQSEYYLTDCPAILLNAGERVVASCQLDIREAKGVNTLEQFAEVQQELEQQAAAAHR